MFVYFQDTHPIKILLYYCETLILNYNGQFNLGICIFFKFTYLCYDFSNLFLYTFIFKNFYLTCDLIDDLVTWLIDHVIVQVEFSNYALKFQFEPSHTRRKEPWTLTFTSYHTRTYTCRVIIALRVCGGNTIVYQTYSVCFMIISFYRPNKTQIDFWFKQRLNSKSLIW